VVFSNGRCRIFDNQLGQAGVFVRWSKHKVQRSSVPADIANDERWRLASDRRAPHHGLFQGALLVEVSYKANILCLICNEKNRKYIRVNGKFLEFTRIISFYNN